MRLFTRGILIGALALTACKVEPNADREAAAQVKERERAKERRVQATCASNATNDRLKQVMFDEAIKIRNADPVNLDTLATYSSVRIESPTLKSRDEALDVIVCGGTLILQLPPGAERAFAGEHNLRSEVEYAAQAAVDGSGLVYRLKGAEPIVYKLAAFDLRRQAYRPTPQVLAIAEPPQPAVAPLATEPAPRPMPRPTIVASARPPEPRRTTPPATRGNPAPDPQQVREVRSSPSFDCRRARSRSERMVCSSDNLAALDRAMSSRFYSALSNADGATRAELRRSRDRFLAFRERCPDAGCVGQAYRDRIDEIRDIAGN